MHTLPLLQIVIVIATAKALGWLMRRLGQPAVIGEMLAGFALGPLVLGQQWPEAHAALFDASTRAGLQVLGELGLVLFVFLVGADFTPPSRTGGGRGVLSVAGWSLALPFLLGLPLAALLHERMAPSGVGLPAFSLFVATVMSVTAFPVLAAILKERGLLHQPEGAMALFAAAVTDAAVWMLLAAVSVLHGGEGGWYTMALRLGGLAALSWVALAVLRPWLARHATRWLAEGSAARVFTLMLWGALAVAALTTWLQVHPAFGAFLFGACLPRDERLRRLIVERLEGLVDVALLPAFFALAGLSAAGSAFGSAGWATLALVVACAMGGKLAGGAIGMRLSGWPWGSAWTVGVLVNARGLMELVVLKIGLDMGLISPELFTLFFVMAIVTTALTGPLLDLQARRQPQPLSAAG